MNEIWEDAHAKGMSIRVLCEDTWEFEEGS